MRKEKDKLRVYQDYIKSLISEQDELNNNINKLKRYIYSDNMCRLSFWQRCKVRIQYKIMLIYFRILDDRINDAAFE